MIGRNTPSPTTPPLSPSPSPSPSPSLTSRLSVNQISKVFRTRQRSDENPADISDKQLVSRVSIRRFPTMGAFIRKDNSQPKQRKILWEIEKQVGRDNDHVDGKSKKVGGVVKKEILNEIDIQKKRPSTPKLERLNSFMRLARMKKRTRQVTIHSLKLAVNDRLNDSALLFVSKLNEKAYRKDPIGMAKIIVKAMENNMSDVVIALLEVGIPNDVNAPVMEIVLDGKEKSTVQCPSFFHLALSYGLDDVVLAMMKKGASLTKTWYGLTPLMIACCIFGRGSADLASILIGCGASPLQGMDYKKFQQIKRLQLSPGQQFKKQFGSPNNSNASKVLMDDAFVFPLDLAIACGNKDVVAVLLRSMTRQFVFSSYFCLTLRMDLEIIAALCESGANINQTNQRGSNFLHMAARNGDLEIVAVALYYGVPVDSQGENGWTALHEAISYKHRSCVKYLIQKGASISIKNSMGEDAKKLASRCGIENVDELLECQKPEIPEINVKQIVSQAMEYQPSLKREISMKLFNRRPVMEYRRAHSVPDALVKQQPYSVRFMRRKSSSANTKEEERLEDVIHNSIISKKLVALNSNA